MIPNRTRTQQWGALSVAESEQGGVATGGRARGRSRARTDFPPDSFTARLNHAFDNLCPPTLGGARTGSVLEAVAGITELGYEISKNTIWYHLNGTIAKPTWESVQAYAAWFGVSTDFFRAETPLPPPAEPPARGPAEELRGREIERLHLEITALDDAGLELVGEMLRIAREQQARVAGRPRRRPASASEPHGHRGRASSAPDQ